MGSYAADLRAPRDRLDAAASGKSRRRVVHGSRVIFHVTGGSADTAHQIDLRIGSDRSDVM